MSAPSQFRHDGEGFSGESQPDALDVAHRLFAAATRALAAPNVTSLSDVKSSGTAQELATSFDTCDAGCPLDGIPSALKIEPVALQALVVDAKEQGLIDPALSTQAIAFFYNALDLGTSATSISRAASLRRPTARDWDALLARILQALGPQRHNDT